MAGPVVLLGLVVLVVRLDLEPPVCRPHLLVRFHDDSPRPTATSPSQNKYLTTKCLPHGRTKRTVDGFLGFIYSSFSSKVVEKEKKKKRGKIEGERTRRERHGTWTFGSCTLSGSRGDDTVLRYTCRGVAGRVDLGPTLKAWL